MTTQAQVFLFMRPPSFDALEDDILDSCKALDVRCTWKLHGSGYNRKVRLFGNIDGVERIARAILYIDRKAIYAN